MSKRTVLLTAIISAVLALIFVSIQQSHQRALQKARFDVQEQKTQNDNLRRDLDQINGKVKQLEQQNTEKDQKIQEQDKQLQAKAAAKAALAAAEASNRAQVVPGGSTGLCSRYRALFEAYPWDVNTAIAICQAESGGDTNIVSPTDDHGLMQINHGLALYGQAIYDPATNIRIAYQEKFAKGGWRHWTVYKTGAYLKYLG